MRSFAEYKTRKTHEYGSMFDASNLPEKFVRYYENGMRIKIRFPWGEEKTGTIGITTGWRPAFLLVRSSRSLGSSVLLGEDVQIVVVKYGRKYAPEER